MLRRAFRAGLRLEYPSMIFSRKAKPPNSLSLSIADADDFCALPDQMQKALRNLTEGTVEELIIIDRLPYPDKSCTYELRAIFASEDANALFDAICKLSNKSRNAFTQFLAYHYNFDYDLQDVGDRYKADIPCLLKLKDLVDNEISISKGVDKLAFIRLKDVLIEAIRRCEG